MEMVLIFALLFLLLFSGLPVFLSLGSLAAGIIVLSGQPLSSLAGTLYGAMDNFVLLAIPLFTLMAQIMAKGGVGDDLFDFVHVWLRHLPGGLAITTVVACSLFAAICGSSTATALTIGTLAVPAMLRYHYDRPFTLGLLAAGGTLGILIPPSGPMIIYGAITDTSVGRLFIAGILPGVAISLLFILYCYLHSRRLPDLAREVTSTWAEKVAALKRVAFSLLLPPVIIGGIYSGAFTPTEAAGIGATMSFIICFVVYRRLKLKDIIPILQDTVKVTSMLLMIIGAAVYFGQVLTINQIPQKIVQFATSLALGKWGFLIFVNLLLLFLGCFLEVVSIILIAVPILFPILQLLRIDPVWFGILFTINMELALITPPVGMNLYVILGLAKTDMAEVLQGVWPFILLLTVGLIIVMLFPSLSLWLPSRAF